MLRRENRLQSAAEFRAVYRSGDVFPGRLVMLYVMRTTAGRKAGVVVSKKVGSAVRRNRVKRVIREALRTRLAAAEGLRVVVRARAAARAASASEIVAEMEELLAKAGVVEGAGG